jgi:hypothetical protein
MADEAVDAEDEDAFHALELACEARALYRAACSPLRFARGAGRQVSAEWQRSIPEAGAKRRDGLQLAADLERVDA